MRFTAIGSVAFIGVLGLAACSNNTDAPADKAAAKGSDAAPAVLEGPKPGKWRITTAMDGMPGGAAIPATEICVTQAVLEPPASGANGQAQGAECTVTPYKLEGNATVATSSCKLPGNMTTTSAVRITGDFNSRYVTEVTTKMDPAPAPNMAETKVTITSERIGDC